MQDFNGLGLVPSLMHALKALRFNTPTPIQTMAIPLVMEGRDVLGTAQTGTGKTGAFGIPLVHRLLMDPTSAALILTPTRELAVQVLDQLVLFLGHKSPVKSALLIGGAPIGKQLSQLKSRPRLIVGTPGRINDHLTRGSLMLKHTNFLVLDETDRMLDMGFGPQLEQIAKHLPKERQTLMFSATLPGNIMSMAQRYLQNPERIAIGSTTTAAPKIKQQIINVSETEKYAELISQIKKRYGSIIIFVKTKHGADRLATKLQHAEYSADSIHGDLRQRQRDRVIQSFRDQKHRIMVATDIAARGLDIPHIEHVINYDLPQNPEDYIHRIGRTARAGAEGEAVCLISPHDRSKWREIQRLIDPQSIDKQSHGGGGQKSRRSDDDASFSRGGGEGKRRKYGNSKSGKKFGGDKFGKKFDGEKGDRKFGRPKFGKKFDSDKPKRNFDGSKPDRKFDTPKFERAFDEPRAERKFDRPKFGKRFDRDNSERSFDGPKSDRKFGGKKFGKKFDGDKPKRNFDGPKSDRAFDGPRSERKFDGAKPGKKFGGKKFGGKRFAPKGKSEQSGQKFGKRR